MSQGPPPSYMESFGQPMPHLFPGGLYPPHHPAISQASQLPPVSSAAPTPPSAAEPGQPNPASENPSLPVSAAEGAAPPPLPMRLPNQQNLAQTQQQRTAMYVQQQQQLYLQQQQQLFLQQQHQMYLQQQQQLQQQMQLQQLQGLYPQHPQMSYHLGGHGGFPGAMARPEAGVRPAAPPSLSPGQPGPGAAVPQMPQPMNLKKPFPAESAPGGFW
ncbi:probable global transcription activator SNF2L2 [Penaeus monodon]|uniref:probable global transcription activator SNF2L2 n=1 Tax=Penaeus monodon TaxID=6687 RepID=UPI0018A73824|nr:probable global transcription activator SNF2L2 [Penaeus monodon]